MSKFMMICIGISTLIASFLSYDVFYASLGRFESYTRTFIAVCFCALLYGVVMLTIYDLLKQSLTRWQIAQNCIIIAGFILFMVIAAVLRQNLTNGVSLSEWEAFCVRWIGGIFFTLSAMLKLLVIYLTNRNDTKEAENK